MGARKEYTVLVDGHPIYVGALGSSQVVFNALMSYNKILKDNVCLKDFDFPSIVLAFGRC